MDFGQDFLSGLESHWRQSNLATKKRIQAFFYPDGGTVSFVKPSRTAAIGTITGSSTPARANLSSMVRHKHAIPNQPSNKERVKKADSSTSEGLTFFLQLYEKFGPPDESPGICDLRADTILIRGDTAGSSLHGRSGGSSL